jgi:ActR/RegA family two-component response regulator
MNPNITFLVLEDDVAIANTLKKEVEKRGFNAFVAYTSKKARELVAQHGAIITHALFDIKLNRESIDGIQLAIEFKAQLPNLVVIFLSAFLKDEGILKRIQQIGEGHTEFVDKTEVEALDDILPHQVIGELADPSESFALRDKIIVLEMHQDDRWVIPLDAIVFIKGGGNHCKMVIQQGNLPFRSLKIGIELKPFVAQLQTGLSPQHAFWKINRSTIINTARIVKYSSGCIYFSADEPKSPPNGETEPLHKVDINQTVQSILERKRFKT